MDKNNEDGQWRRLVSKDSREFEGWLTSYKINRELNPYELDESLNTSVPIDIWPSDRGLIKANGAFLEFIDRYFYLRGWAAMGCMPIAGACLYLFFLFGGSIHTPPNNGGTLTFEYVFSGWLATVLFGLLLAAICFFGLQKDFFCYTHYPIRFNRLNRKVYVFRHNGKGGVLALDWDKAYWFVGRTRDGSDISYDLRCHVLDTQGIVRDTFAVGHFAATRAEILQHWEMIRRYMEESPATLPFPPLALVISTEPTWRNCLTIQVGGTSGHSPSFMLLTVPWAFFRWISQLTCRRPRWPDEVEEACQVPPDDPYRLPEPVSCGVVAGMDAAAEAALLEYREKAQLAAEAYENAHPKPDSH